MLLALVILHLGIPELKMGPPLIARELSLTYQPWSTSGLEEMIYGFHHPFGQVINPGHRGEIVVS